jgi:hypothetical protein
METWEAGNLGKSLSTNSTIVTKRLKILGQLGLDFTSSSTGLNFRTYGFHLETCCSAVPRVHTQMFESDWGGGF